MLNLIRRFLRPSLREQLEDGVREALKRYTDRRSAPDLRVYISTDLLPDHIDPALWSQDEGDHLRRFATQWAQDNGIFRAGLRIDIILLDTKREFAFVKPLGLDAANGGRTGAPREGSRPLVAGSAAEGAVGRSTPGSTAVLDVVSSPIRREPLQVHDEAVVGRRTAEGVVGLDDRYMSGRHARLHISGGRLWVTDLDSKNRTYVNDQPLAPNQARELAIGDSLRMGTTVLRLARLGS